VYGYGVNGVQLWGERCTDMGSTVCSYGEPHMSENKEFTVNGVQLWGERCTDMGRAVNMSSNAWFSERFEMGRISREEMRPRAKGVKMSRCICTPFGV
jgi:hypothetical protein